MPSRLDWAHDGHDWPNRAASRFLTAGRLRWHVQVLPRGADDSTGAGPAPVLLLLHGTGASTHSWRELAPALARHFTVVAPDLPGHGFTGQARLASMSLPGMAKAVRELLDALELAPDLAVGHSAGAAILARMNIDGLLPVERIVALNGAFLPFEGLSGHLFAPLAKLFANLPFVPSLFAWRASDPRTVERLLRDTGSTLDEEGVGFYLRLARNPEHVRAALDMMANWDLQALQRDLPRLPAHLSLIAGAGDRTVRPHQSRRVQQMVSRADFVELPGLGHLAHEEEPETLAGLILPQPAPAGAGAVDHAVPS